jgi:hypothetical protein
MDRVEAAGSPALVLHRIPSCRAEAAPGWLDGSGHVQTAIEPSVTRRPLAQQMRAASVAQIRAKGMNARNAHEIRLPRASREKLATTESERIGTKSPELERKVPNKAPNRFPSVRTSEVAS